MLSRVLVKAKKLWTWVEMTGMGSVWLELIMRVETDDGNAGARARQRRALAQAARSA